MLTLKKYFKTIKPCVIGTLMVIIGILSTRKEIGYGRLSTNIIFGTCAYFFLALSGLIIIEYFKIREDPSYISPLSKKKALILFIEYYSIGIIITFLNIILFNLNSLILFIIAPIGVIWVCLGMVGTRKRKQELINKITISLIFSLGLVYGAVLNNVLIPIYIYYFFVTSFSLYLSRVLLKEDFLTPKDVKIKGIPKNLKKTENLKHSLILQIVGIVFFILPLFTKITYPMFYFFHMIIGLIFIGFASFLTLKSTHDEREVKKINKSIKIAIFIALLAFIFSN